jgi:hypothetical protein
MMRQLLLPFFFCLLDTVDLYHAVVFFDVNQINDRLSAGNVIANDAV